MEVRYRKFEGLRSAGMVGVYDRGTGEMATEWKKHDTDRRAEVLKFLESLSPSQVLSITEAVHSDRATTTVWYVADQRL